MKDPPSYVHPPDSGAPVGVPTLEELGWSKMAMGPEGKTYYLNHADKSGHWELPPEVLAKLTGDNDPAQSNMQLGLGATAGTLAVPAITAQPSDSVEQGPRVHVSTPGLQTEVVTIYLQHDRLYGQPGTDGSVCSNLWHYAKTHHPLTAPFCTDQRKTSRAQLLYIFWVSQTILYFTWAHPALIAIFADINCAAGCNSFDWPPPSNFTAIHESELYNAGAWPNGTTMCTPIGRYEKPICEQLGLASQGRSDDKLMLKIESLDIAQVYLGQPESINIKGEGMYVFETDWNRMCEGYDAGTVFSSLWFGWTILIFIINWAVNLVLTWAFQSNICKEACSCLRGCFLGVTGFFWGFGVALANLVAIFNPVFRDEFATNYIVMIILIFVLFWPIELPLRFGLLYGADREWFRQNFGDDFKNIEQVVADAQFVGIAKTAVSKPR